MCGIAGLWRGDGSIKPAHIVAVTNALNHRGPDAGAQWWDHAAGLAFGHRRLAIIDLSDAGAQPMHSACGRYVIVLNGEIYNFRELRQEIEQSQPIAWRGHSDTEVVLAAISAWGFQNALRRIVGMFALALWDKHARTLHLARDRLGEKPLYYGWAGETFIFASELKAFRAYPEFPARVDRNALTLLLRHSYIPAPYCIYEGVQKLIQGTSLTLTASDVRARKLPEPQPYWSLREVAERGQRTPFPGDDTMAIDELERLLKRSVADQMIADVPLGAFLSGGIDSSTIVALMQSQSSRRVRTFSIGFHETGFDEAAHAAAVARHLGTDHTELYVSAEQALQVIPNLPSIYDEPLADSSQIPTYLVSQLARQHVTVALTGDAGDELFGGYNHYEITRRIWNSIRWTPALLRRFGAAVLQAIPARALSAGLAPVRNFLPVDPRERDLGGKLHTFAEIARIASSDDLYRNVLSHWKQPAKIVLGSSEPLTRFRDPEQMPLLADLNHRMMYLDGLCYLPDDVLVKVDRAAMAVSLETRVPLLDHRIVEFAWQLPLKLKIRGNERKWILKQLLLKYVPQNLIERPKMGFGVPIDTWLRGSLREWAESLLGEERLRREGYFDSASIRARWEEHVRGERNWSFYLWDVLMFQAWLDAAKAPTVASRYPEWAA